jgi:hypothetical protein
MPCKTSLVLVFAGVLASGCIRSTTTIELKADGSGTILQENAVGAQALAMMKSFASAQTDKAGTQTAPDIFSEDQARKTAETMGVTFVSGEPFKTGDLQGYRARYRFDDVTKIKINAQQGPDSLGPATAAKEPPFGFTFERGAASSLLTIQMPQQTPLGNFPMPGAGSASEGDKAMATQALAMMKMMMQGAFLDVSLAVDGRIIKSNAAHVDGSKITLLQVDFDKLMADEATLKKLEAAKDPKALADLPGLKIATEPKLVIEFSR